MLKFYRISTVSLLNKNPKPALRITIYTIEKLKIKEFQATYSN
jgi:hypothetical protein